MTEPSETPSSSEMELKVTHNNPPGLMDLMRTVSRDSDTSLESVPTALKENEKKQETNEEDDDGRSQERIEQLICERAFNLFDQSKSGTISLGELKLLVSSLGKRYAFCARSRQSNDLRRPHSHRTPNTIALPIF